MDEEQQAAGNGIEIMRAHLLAHEAERHPYRLRLHHLATTHKVNTSSSSSSGTIENENSKPDNEGFKNPYLLVHQLVSHWHDRFVSRVILRRFRKRREHEYYTDSVPQAVEKKQKETKLNLNRIK